MKGIADVSNYGSMVRATGANKMRTTITKSTVISNAVSLTTSLASAGDSLYQNGNFLNLSISGALNDLYPSGLPQIYNNFDKFRISKVEFFIQVSENDGVTPELTIFSSEDTDDALPTTWDVFRTRKNVALNSTNTSRPLICLAAFQPTANYAVSTVSSTPSNAVPNKNTWFDCSAVSQQYVGLKLHIAGPNASVSNLSIFAKADVEFKSQV